MRNINLLLLLLALILSASTCSKEGECHRYIWFYNQTNRDVYVSWSYTYPDTLYLIHGPSPSGDPLASKVNASSSSRNPLRNRDCWEDLFGDLIPSDTLMVYLFDAEVLETVDWSTVIMENMILRRYDLSLDDLRRMNWEITYP